MKYTELLKVLAKESNTTPEEVEKEMRFAIRKAGYDIEPALFISLVTIKIKSEINKI